MDILEKQITLDEIEILREPLEKLHTYHNTHSKYFSGDYPRITFEERIKKYRKNTEIGEYRIEVFYDKKTMNLIAFSIEYREDASGKIEVLYVDESYRRNHLGTKLMNNALKWFREKGIFEIELTVVYGNQDAATFYENFGFFPRSIIMETKSS
ncbi:GNAT family N-acetyltransferase [Cytobacillus sp. Hz8]|uniref:GNAT family N-acetyltransferase n=1 Tax=Cytobacillus sp. Hz8 TaxID=3347168 RepID=UPI0035D89540